MPNSQKIRHSLSSAQSGMWFAQQLDPLNPIYNTGEYVENKRKYESRNFSKLAVRKVVMEAEALLFVSKKMKLAHGKLLKNHSFICILLTFVKKKILKRLLKHG
ncbi:hypothetical protein ACT7DA_19060 [Bacillus pacificus]